MSNDDQMMMNQAHGLTPDDGHDEDLIARRQEDLAKEMYDFLGEISEKIQTFNHKMTRRKSSGQPPVVPDDKLWDTGLAWEREFNLYPDASRDVVISRLYNQVWDLLQKMKERVTQRTWKTEDQEIVEGLINVMILSVRINLSTDHMLKDQVENHAT